jgi:hypothetical protein
MRRIRTSEMNTEKNEDVQLVPADSSHGKNPKMKNTIKIRIPILPHDY